LDVVWPTLVDNTGSPADCFLSRFLTTVVAGVSLFVRLPQFGIMMVEIDRQSPKCANEETYQTAEYEEGGRNASNEAQFQDPEECLLS
jgi:hypothetical protein